MARIRTLDFLPEIFKTAPNTQFLSATLDQLVSKPQLRKIDGFIGQHGNAKATDNYLLEETKLRNEYQLEPATVFVDEFGNAKDVISYPEMIDSLRTAGANVDKHDRLWSEEYYSWDSFVDLDKLVNFSQYYWLPFGPDPVDVFASTVATTDTFEMVSGKWDYTTPGNPTTNPTITLARGGHYTFKVNQPGSKFWIQTHPGVEGVQPHQSNVSSREILGVVDNGTDTGEVLFNVPQKDAQNFYLAMSTVDAVNYATTMHYDQINNMPVDTFLLNNNGIDGQNDVKNKTLIIFNEYNSGWTNVDTFADEGFDSQVFAEETPVTDYTFTVWRIELVDNGGDEEIIKLVPIAQVPTLHKVLILAGKTHGNLEYYRTADSKWKAIPVITALNDILYYQDGTDADKFGVIKLVDSVEATVLNVEDIIGKDRYTSPNGVAFSNGMKVVFRGNVFPVTYLDKNYYVEGVGDKIQLVESSLLVTPERYTRSKQAPYDSNGFDTANYDAVLNSPQDPDYFTMNRGSLDGNAWSRSNRWFHIDVINTTAQHNSTIPLIDQSLRAQRPIIEYRKNLRLYNYGTKAKLPVDVFDTVQLDALSNVHGAVGYIADGVKLEAGMRIVFAADTDAMVRGKIYTVTFIDPDGTTPVYDQIINLVPAEDSEILIDETITVRNGLNGQGQVYYYNGNEWYLAQQKTTINQAPLFEVYDLNGHMYSDTEYYPGTSFKGAELFSYVQQAGGKMDPILKIRLKYATFNNVGDILFKSGLQNDEFVYVEDNKSITKSIRNSFIREYSDRTSFALQNGWTKHIVNDVTYQKFVFSYTGDALVLDVLPRTERVTPIKVFADGNFVNAEKYTVTLDTEQNQTKVELSIPATTVEVLILSDDISANGFYQVPKNLERNPFNDDITTLTLGLIRDHYTSITRNHPDLLGTPIGANNTRDLGNIAVYGDTIVKHSSLVSLASTFLRSKKYDFFGAVEWSGIEYEKFKNFIVATLDATDYGDADAATILDQVIEAYTLNKTEESPFYYGDMIAHGKDYVETSYIFSAISTNVFDTVYTYDFTKANHNAILVYLNGSLLLKDVDYEVADDGPRLTIYVPLVNDDVVIIREYTTTVGSCVPVTPTKMGMYDLYEPRMMQDTSYSTPQTVLRGHDGSAMVAFGDMRDLVLLEYEKRVYNNFKGTKYVPLTFADVIPGAFRKTEYSIEEIDSILNPMFLRWAGTHRLDYTVQDYDEQNEFTWNYSKTNSKLDDKLLDGGWRAVYRHYYDTDTPHLTPWELLGLTEMPLWWEERYGPAPYTKNNMVLWDDLEAGIIAAPDNYHVDERYKRPGLTTVLPVDDQGALVSPYVSIVKHFDIRLTKGEWTSGDGGPVESAWYRSSAWPFAMQKLLALTKPASYFSLYIDKDRYHYNELTKQFMLDGTSPLRLDALNIADTRPAHSYVNYIVDYNKVIGRNNVAELTYDLSHMDVRLAYRMAGYSDKKYLKLIVEKTSPNSDSNNLIMPDENYSLLLHDNEIHDQVVYSAVIVQKTKNGYKVYGTDEAKQYFEIFKSLSFGRTKQVEGIAEKITMPVEFDYNTIVQVPYGTEFLNKSTVVDFLISYSKYLEHKGLQFKSVIDNTEISWAQVAEEFVYWTEQGWEEGAIIQLNPSAVEIAMSRPGSVVAGLQNYARDNYVLDQNNRIIQHKNMVVTRVGNDFTMQPLESIVAFAKLNLISYEHVLVLDNKTVFNDTIYDLATGSRQVRIRVNGYKTAKWNGSLQADGFIVATAQPEEWKSAKVYKKGDVVTFKGKNWVATENVQPSDKFDYGIWSVANLNTSNQLLQNLSTKAGLFEDFYSTQSVNLEQDTGVLGRGLIGYRPREYMSNLFTDDTSQFQLYSNFIPVKGTPAALDKIRNISLDKESSDYTVYENWAIKLSEYGATDSKRFIETTLSGQRGSNPYTVQVTANNFTTSEADEVIPVAKLYDHNLDNIASADIFKTTFDRNYETTLPTAGYVNINDTDVAVFDIKDLTELRNKIDLIEEGAIVWIAKINDVNWGIYKVTTVHPTIAAITNNYDGTSTLTFKTPHTLAKNEIIIIKYFEGFNGAYNILSVTNQFNVVIDYAFPSQSQIASYPGQGVLFKLRTVRVKQPSDIANLDYVTDDGDLVWVDDVDGKWEVVQKQSPWSVNSTPLLRTSSAPGTGYGNVVAASPDGVYILAGDAAQNTISSFIKIDTGEIVPNIDVTLTTTDTVGFGSAIEVGGKEWSIAGASESDSNRGYAAIIRKDQSSRLIGVHQILVAPGTRTAGDKFGYAVTMSADERWAYVGAPGAKQVHAYGLVKVDDQALHIIADGSDKVRIDDVIQFNNPFQVEVFVDDTELTLADWNLLETAGQKFVKFQYIPEVGQKILVRRKTRISMFATGVTASYSVTELYNALYTESLVVYIDGKLQRPAIDYNLVGSNIVFTVTPALNKGIIIDTPDHYRYTATLSDPDLTVNYFGAALSTTTDGRQVFVGAPLEDEASTDAGKVYVFDRVVERFIANGDTNVFTTNRAIVAPCSVKVNDDFLYDASMYIDGDYTLSGNVVTLGVAPTKGFFVDIETNKFEMLLQTITSEPRTLAQFGSTVKVCPSNCSFYAGAPMDSTGLVESGSVVRYVNIPREYGIITGTFTSVIPGETLRINNVEVTFTGTTLTSAVNDINSKAIPNVKAYASNGKLTIGLINPVRGTLDVLPGTGNAMTTLGMNTFQETQRIYSPSKQEGEKFGYKISVSPDAQKIAVSTPVSNVVKEVTIDGGSVTFDSGATRFKDWTRQTGTVYLYELLQAANNTPTTPKKMVFAQQIDAPIVTTYDKFGESIALLDNKLFVGAPLDDTAGTDHGSIVMFNNPNRDVAWTTFRQEEARIDTQLIKGVTLIDKDTGLVKNYLDYIDPLNGKVLGAVRSNIDYITFNDPAQYNSGASNVDGYTWAAEHVGEVWWNLTNLRYIDYYQSSISFKAKRWSQLFPGSLVEVYQWVASDVAPAQYTGEGTVLDTTSYTVLSENKLGTIVPKYYFWVKNVTTVDRLRNKSLSTAAIASYIENTKASGVPYAAILGNNAFALYNASDYLDDNTVVRIDFDLTTTSANVHTEYELIRAGDADSYLSPMLQTKLIDSLTGVDSIGNRVPGLDLPEPRAYGVKFRPRQSMFKNRKVALRTYIDRVNRLLRWYPVVGNKKLDGLRVVNEMPGAETGAWDIRLANLSELSYQNLNILATGTKFLVEVDSTNNNRWAIYQLNADKTLNLVIVQSFDTNQYWEYIDWYQDETVQRAKISKVVDRLTDLPKIVAQEGNIVKVRFNLANVWELHRYTNGQWVRVAVQNGTIQVLGSIFDTAVTRVGFDAEVFDVQYFDQEPIVEIRYILEAVNTDLLIDDLALARNELLVMMFNYIIAEQPKVDWLIKTSLVDVTHKIRTLDQFGIYRRDNQEFVLDYINEVKPYHVQVKDFTLEYNTLDLYEGDITDFDVPVYYDEATGRFIAPHVGVEDDAFWQKPQYREWANNHLFAVEDILMIEQGTGYTIPPEIIVEGECVAPAQARAKINSAGRVVAIVLTDPGIGYSNTPVVRINGGNGTGAMAIAKLKTPLVRSIKTLMKFDRIEYKDNIIDWASNIELFAGEIVRYQEQIFRVLVDHTTDAQFADENFKVADQATLNAADRVMGFYKPGANQVGQELSLVEKGIVYPGVQVLGLDFTYNPGYDLGRFDTSTFDNMEYGPEGYPTVSDSMLDSAIESQFTDGYLGTRPEDISIDGGAYVDEYSSHGPEELVPGRVFDTLDMEIYTRPGWDYTGNGIGPDIRVATKSYTSSTTNDTVSFFDYMLYPAAVKVFSTRFQALTEGVHYTVNWKSQTVTSLVTHSANDKLLVYIYGVAGGNKIFENSYNGTMAVDNTIELPVGYHEVKEVVVVKNGVFLTSAEYAVTDNDPYTSVTFAAPLANDDYVYVDVQGYEDVDNGISTLRTANFVVDASVTRTFALPFTLDDAGAVNTVVELNGKRLQAPAGIRHVRNSGRQIFPSINTLDIGYTPDTVSENEFAVFVNAEKMILTVDYNVVDPQEGLSYRDINFLRELNDGDIVDIYITRGAKYKFNNGVELQILDEVTLVENDRISVSSYGDYSQLRALTYVFKGPRTVPVLSAFNFDSQGYGNDFYDQFIVDNALANRFDLKRIDILGFDTVPYDNDMFEQELTDNVARDGGRLWVTLNGNRLHHNVDYIVQGTEVVIQGVTINATDIVVITAITANTANIATGYRYFKDLQDNFRAYRLDKNFITELAQPLVWTDTEIYVKDASRLPAPNLPRGVFGVIMIGAEKIYYRERDVNNNVLRGLRRGVGGTAVGEYYEANDRIFDTSVNQVIEASDYVFKNVYAYDKADVEDYAPWATLTYPLRMGATEIYVNDVSQLDLPETFSYYDVNDVLVEYTKPAVMIVGNEKIYYTEVNTATNVVSGLQRDPSGVGAYIVHEVGTGVYGTTHSSTTNGTWYQIDTAHSLPSDGVPLQNAATAQAVFIREHGVVLPR